VSHANNVSNLLDYIKKFVSPGNMQFTYFHCRMFSR